MLGCLVRDARIAHSLGGQRKCLCPGQMAGFLTSTVQIPPFQGQSLGRFASHSFETGVPSGATDRLCVQPPRGSQWTREQRALTEREAQVACCHNNNPGASYLLVCPPNSYFEI